MGKAHAAKERLPGADSPEHAVGALLFKES